MSLPMKFAETKDELVRSLRKSAKDNLRMADLQKPIAMTLGERYALIAEIENNIADRIVAMWKREQKRKPMTNTAFDYSHHYLKVYEHYTHARTKHPYFCDRITCLSDVGSDTHLDIYRSTLKAETDNGCVEADTVLMCEFYEALQAYTHGDTANAVEECYDAIAVLLRTIDVLEGRQKLGKPETKGAK